MITLESEIRVSPDVLFEEVMGEAVLLNLSSGKYYGLDPVGTRMWSLLSQDGRLRTAHQALLKEYAVSEEKLAEDLQTFVGRLLSLQMLEADEK